MILRNPALASFLKSGTALAVGLALVFSACSKDSDKKKSDGDDNNDTTLASLSKAVAPLGLTTPVAKVRPQVTTRFPRLHRAFDKVKSLLHLPTANADGPAGVQAYSAIETSFNALLDSASVADAVSGFTLTPPAGSPANCYGPSIQEIANHPDGSCGGGGQPPCMLPSGDLGIWTPTESSTGEACSAAKVNSIVSQLHGTVQQGMILMAGVIVSAKLQGLEPPAEGESIDATSDLAAALTSFTVSSASISGLAPSGANAVYQTQVTGTNNTGGVLSFTQKHSPGDATNSIYSGIFYGYYPVSDNMQPDIEAVAFSLTYVRTADAITFFFNYGLADTNGSDLLNNDGTLNFSSNHYRGNGNRILVELNPTTNLGTIYVAWQAGGNAFEDTRVFQAASSTSNGVTTGVAYFGYGAPLPSTDGSIDKMICNWAGPGNNHNGLVNFAQAQTLTQDATTGAFELDESHTTYANTNTCDNGDNSYQMTQPNGQNVSSTLVNVGIVTNNLVSYGSVGTIPAVTVPVITF